MSSMEDIRVTYCFFLRFTLLFATFFHICLSLNKESPIEKEKKDIEYPTWADLKEKLGHDYYVRFYRVGLFIAGFKYYGADLRYQAGKITAADYIFYKNFPLPVLKKFHPVAKIECEKGARPCLDEVLSKANKSGVMKHIYHEEDRLPWAPFKDDYELFQYRLTAMYYLCWYALKGEKKISYLNFKMPCLNYIWALDDVPEEERKIMYKDKVEAISDSRSIGSYFFSWFDILNSKRYNCPRLWFCPDPCYGRETQGNVDLSSKDEGNPCRHLKNDKCDFKEGANNNFHDVIRNKVNITCNCTTDFKGFEWESKFGLCVDKDECYDGISKCKGSQICRNTVGSYICTCPKGYKLNNKTEKCEKTAVLHQKARILENKEEIDEFEKGDFITDLMDFVGLSRAQTVHLSFACLSFLSITMLFLI